jgi:Protein of unknown function (DUF1579)
MGVLKMPRDKGHARGAQRRGPGWRRFLPAGVIGAALSVILSPTAPIPASSAPPQQMLTSGVSQPREPLAEQMHQLDFLLGYWKCVLTHTSDPDNPINQIYTIRSTLGGNWYEMHVYQPPTPEVPNPTSSRTIMGWNNATSTFVDFYFDSKAGQGTGTSPGWQDGHLVFTTDFLFNTVTRKLRDDFVSLDSDHFVDYFSALRNGNWVATGVLECTRV